MDSKKITARKAGVLYLLIAITGGFGIMYVSSNIIISGDASATVNNMLNAEFTYRLSIVSNLASQILMVFLVFTLYRLLKEVNSSYAKYMVALVMISVPISFLNTLNLVAAQIFASNSDYLASFDINQLNSMTLFFLNLYEKGITIVGVFWGLWLFPLGMLIIKSKFIPKIIGIFLVIGCFAYLIDSLISLLLPEYKEIISQIIVLPLIIGEFSIVLWLLIKGVRD